MAEMAVFESMKQEEEEEAEEENNMFEACFIDHSIRPELSRARTVSWFNRCFLIASQLLLKTSHCYTKLWKFPFFHIDHARLTFLYNS